MAQHHWPGKIASQLSMAWRQVSTRGPAGVAQQGAGPGVAAPAVAQGVRVLVQPEVRLPEMLSKSLSFAAFVMLLLRP